MSASVAGRQQGLSVADPARHILAPARSSVVVVVSVMFSSLKWLLV